MSGPVYANTICAHLRSESTDGGAIGQICFLAPGHLDDHEYHTPQVVDGGGSVIVVRKADK